MATPVPDVVVWPNHNTVLDLSSLLGALARSLGRRVCGEARVAFSLVAAPDLDHFVGMVHEFGALQCPCGPLSAVWVFEGSVTGLTRNTRVQLACPSRKSFSGEATRSLGGKG